jgi:hypothetical protein
MFSAQNEFALVTRFVRNLRGGSQPFLAQASDGQLYVVKLVDNLQGENLLFNESAGSELYRACGLAVPKWKPLTISDAFLDKNPDCWMQTPEGSVRPASGLCFGSRFLGQSGNRLLEVLPGSSFTRIRNRADFWLAWLVDVCAAHGDHRQAIIEEESDGWLDAYFVDHGHMFGGPQGTLKKQFTASSYLDPRIYLNLSSEELLNFQAVVRALDTDKLMQRAESLPAEWRQASALDGFASCLQRLSKPLLVQNVLDTIIDAQQRRTETKQRIQGSERKPVQAVLYPGIQAPGFGASYAHHPACA